MQIKLLRFWPTMLVFCGFMTDVNLFAEEYRPPETPPLYAKEELVYPELRAKSGFHAGAELLYGQLREDNIGRGPVYLYAADLGYYRNVGPWNRFEASLQLFSGKASFSGATVDYEYGFLVQVGYGHGLGGDLLGKFQVGAGLSNSRYSFSATGDSEKGYRETEGTLGSIIQAGYDIILPVHRSYSVVVEFLHPRFSERGEVEYEDRSKGA